MGSRPTVRSLWLVLFALLAAISTNALDHQFEIASITVEVDGWTQRQAILDVAEVAVGDRYLDSAELLFELARARQRLVNRRVFESVVVDYAPVEGSQTEIDLFIVVVDGWSLLAVPFYRFDTNSGHNPLLVLQWDNIAGSLTNFDASTGYYSRNWTTPYSFDVTLEWERIRWLGREWRFRIRQEYLTRERATDGGRIEFAYTFWTTRFSFATSFDLGERLRYSIAPTLAFDYEHNEVINTIGETVPDSRSAVSFSHSIGAGGLDWIGNLRRGTTGALSNSLSWDIDSSEVNAGFAVDAQAHGVVGPWGPAVRFAADVSLAGSSFNRAAALRGVADNRMSGQAMAVLNAQLSLDLIDLSPVADVVPLIFLDAGVTRKPVEPFSDDDLGLGTGFEIIVYPDIFRGFLGRFTFGFNVIDLARGLPLAPALEFAITNTFQF